MEFQALQQKVRDVFFTKLCVSMSRHGFYRDSISTPDGQLPHRVTEGAAHEVLQYIELPNREVIDLLELLHSFAKGNAERWQRERAIQLKGAIEVALCCSEVREQLGFVKIQLFDLPKRGAIFALHSAAELFLLD